VPISDDEIDEMLDRELREIHKLAMRDPTILAADLAYYLREGHSEIAELIANWLDPGNRARWQLVFRRRPQPRGRPKDKAIATRDPEIIQAIELLRQAGGKLVKAIEGEVAARYGITDAAVHQVWIKRKRKYVPKSPAFKN
jgi:hypothetical protein